MTPTSQFAQHPGIESLNAFVENALPAPERESILAHLAACSRCRQITWLAQSAAEEETSREAASRPVEPARIEPGKIKPAGNGFRQWLAGFKAGNRRLVVLAVCTALAAFTFLLLPRYTVEPSLQQQEAKSAPAPDLSSAPAPNIAQSQLKPTAPEHPRSVAMGSGTAHPSLSAASRTGIGQNGSILAPQTPMQAQHESLGSVTGRSYESAALPAPQPIPSASIGSTTETVAVSPAPPSLRTAPQPELQQTISAAQIATPDSDAARKAVPAAAKSASSRAAVAGGPGFGRARGGIAATYGANRVVAIPQAARSATFYAHSASVNDDFLAGKAMQTVLPTGSHPAAAVAVRQRVLAMDPSGALYLSRNVPSQNAGILWLPVTQQWTGRATSLRIFTAQPDTAQPADGKTPAAVDQISPVAGSAPARDTGAPRPLFELTTDQGARWFSEDGNTWKQRDKP